MLYEDAQGVLWCRAWGVLRPEMKTRQGRGEVYVDELGGQSWTKRGRYFVCEHATNWQEAKRYLPDGLEGVAGELESEVGNG
jgi:hypothetical protein